MRHAAGAASFGGARFRLVKFHAKGGLGEVWVARDVELNRDVALKQIQEDHADDPQSQARFLHEAEVTGRLEHRGIVPVYGLGHFENGRPFYAMRFVSGTSLKEAIAKFHEAKAKDTAGADRSLELRRLVGTFVDVCNTVAYAHSRGVLHRDLKPANIILDEYGETLVVDWGLAKTGSIDVESASNGGTLPPVSTSCTPYTWAGTKMGTPGYMSPEQATGRLSDVGPASDVYSLGATLYCLLTGQAPFGGAGPVNHLAQYLRGRLSPASRGRVDRARRTRGDLPESHGSLSGKSIRESPGARRRNRALAGRSTGSGLSRAYPGQGHPLGSPAQAMGRGRGRRAHPDRARTVDLQLANHQAEGQTRHDPGRSPRSPQGFGGKPGQHSQYREAARAPRPAPCSIATNKSSPSSGPIRASSSRWHRYYRVIGGIGRISGQFAKSKESYEKAIQLIDDSQPERPPASRLPSVAGGDLQRSG